MLSSASCGTLISSNLSAAAGESILRPDLCHTYTLLLHVTSASSTSSMMASCDIRVAAQECIDRFQLLIGTEREIGSNNEAEDSSHDVIRIEDQFARFKMWAGNIGVFAEDHASLDYRLRDSEETRQCMLSFLHSLAGFIQRAVDTINPGSITDQLLRADSPVDDNVIDGTDSFDLSVPSTTSSAFQGTETESQQDASEVEFASDLPLQGGRLQRIEKAIDRLYRLSLIIRQPSRFSRHERVERFIMFDEDGNEMNEQFAAFADQLVNHKFAEAPDYLRRKLSRGIVTRRKRFLWRQSHQRKLSGVGSVPDGAKPKLLALDGPRHPDSTIRGTSVVDEARPTPLTSGGDHARIHTAPSKTSASGLPDTPLPLATALEDEQSVQSTTFTMQSAAVSAEMPRPPKPANGSKEFECPYCCLVLPIKHLKAHRWRRHIIEDLEPYTCVFRDCVEDSALFRDRATWTTHLEGHTARWVCTNAGHATSSFKSEESYLNHMMIDHAGTFTKSQLPILASRSKVPTHTILQQCPLCLYSPEEAELNAHLALSPAQRERLKSERIVKHLAVHLEALAVKSLPWQDSNGEETEPSSQSGRSDDVTVRSEEGSHAHTETSKSSLTFTEQCDEDDLLIEPPSTSDAVEPLSDSTYEQDWGFIGRPPYFGHDRDEVLQPLLQRLFLGRSAPSDVIEPKLPAYMVPVYRDRRFYGRDYALNMMQQTLCKSGNDDVKDNKPLSWPRCYAIYGPGGMGKTQVAAHFVSEHRKKFDAVLWVHAENSNKIAQDYKDIAAGLGLVSADSRDAMDLDYTKDVVKRWLVNPQKKKPVPGEKKPGLASWLLVFDGVEDGRVLNEFWPYNGPGSIIITSRNPHSWSASLELKPFSVQEATDYLFHLTEREPSPEERIAANHIVKQLGGLPLALSQMAGIIAYQGVSFVEFLQWFEKHEGSQKFLDWRFTDNQRPLSNYEYNVASVWAFDRLGKGEPLINIISMLDPDAIPESLFTSPARDEDSDLVQLIKSDYLTSRTELLARSLITGNKREKKLFVHKLVQDVARSRMRQSDIRRNFWACVELINTIWPFQELTWRHGVARWADCEALFPHVQRLKAIYPSISPSPDSFEDYEFARLLIDSGWYQHERGKSLDAILSNNMAQSICESLKLRLLENPSLAKGSSVSLVQLNYSLVEMAHNRGCIALEINEPVDALKFHKLFNDTMVKDRSAHDHEDMRLAISWNELGNAHMLNRDWIKGEECFLKSIEEMRKYTKFKPTTISLPLANLGLAYWLQGKNDLARSVLLEGLAAREAEFGVDDRESFITGRFLHALGNVESSLEYHRRALMHYKSTLGNRHHRTADVFVKVAEHNIGLGNNELALVLLDFSMDAFSVSHTYMPEKTRAGWMRYKALKGLGKMAEAEAELAKCYQVYYKLRTTRNDSILEIKKSSKELDDRDIDDLIVFWSK
ncbi:hypothetical protein BKA63DRAFT_160945 [Paraphoma chrysanthemicola]|nr:hypothetical protein BKA63DRAFT_160945 [Paraphoma chrysanthemicola]